MKYTSSLLQQYITLQCDPYIFGELLTRRSCEVETVVEKHIPESVVIGKTIKVEKHPDADKLMVCQVDCGQKWVYQIITGGENIVAQQYVSVALPGTYLASIDLHIEARKMRGLESNGMICSKGELQILEDEDKHWIWLLLEDFDDLSEQDCGTGLGIKYPWLNRQIWEVDNKSITHRPDLTWHFGLAVECKALLDPNMYSFECISDYIGTYTDGSLQAYLQSLPVASRSIQVQTSKLRAYMLLELPKVLIQRSSIYTRIQLLDIDSTPKSNWVDFSNIFMNLSWQPVHFFDAAKVDGDIIVRMAQDGEQFVDLQGNTHILAAEDIVIADHKNILALAGIIGWQSSAISEDTSSILVEIANFDPIAVRKTAQRIWLRTDAVARYEKNIHPAYTMASILQFFDMLTYYTKDIGNHDIGGIHWWMWDHTWLDPRYISLDWSYVDTILHKDSQQLAQDILPQIWFNVYDNRVLVPLRRWPADMQIQEDVIEEIARLHGYDTFTEQEIQRATSYSPMNPDVILRRSLESISVERLGMDHLETYPYVHDDTLANFNVDTKHLYQMRNPLDSQASYLRDSMVYNLLTYAAKNAKFFDRFALQDIGKVWSKEFTILESGTQYADALVGEQDRWAAIWYAHSIQVWQEDTILLAKSSVQTILKLLELTSDITIESSAYQEYHPSKQGYILYEGIRIWFVASIHPLLINTYKFPEQAQVSFVELYLPELLTLTLQKSQTHTDYSTLQDQIVSRDICFLVAQNYNIQTLVDHIQAIDHVVGVDILDIYQGTQLAVGIKSVTINLDIQGENMDTASINIVLDQAITIGEKLWAQLRK